MCDTCQAYKVVIAKEGVVLKSNYQTNEIECLLHEDKCGKPCFEHDYGLGVERKVNTTSLDFLSL
jgi:hypothetical protein